MEQPEPSHSDDIALIQAALRGEPEAFRSIVESHQGPLFDLCARVLRDDVEADDVVQETFLKLYKNLARYQAGHKLQNWLYTIALNLCRNRLRRRKILRIISLDFLKGTEDDPRPMDVAGNDVSALAFLEQKEAEEILDRLVAALPDKLKAPFLLRYHRRLPDSEIATILGISLNHTRVRLSRARALLWDRYSKVWRNFDEPDASKPLVIPASLEGK